MLAGKALIDINNQLKFALLQKKFQLALNYTNVL